MATFWERAAHSVNHMFSLYFEIVNLVISNFGFDGRSLFLIVSVPGQWLPFTFQDIGCCWKKYKMNLPYTIQVYIDWTSSLTRYCM